MSDILSTNPTDDFMPNWELIRLLDLAADHHIEVSVNINNPDTQIPKVEHIVQSSVLRRAAERLIQMHNEIVNLRQENNRLHTECGHREADVVELRQELSEVRESVRTLLRDARRWSDSEWYLIVGAEAYEAARAAGGGE